MNRRPDELIGKRPKDIFSEELAGQIEANDRRVLETAQVMVSETVQQFDDGMNRTIVTHKSPLMSADGEAIAVTTVHTDITARVRAEQALREREERFKQFAESASDWFWETGADHCFTYLSDRFYESTGFSPEDEIWSLRDQQPIPPASQPDGPWAAHLAALDAHAPFKDFEHGFVAPDGKARYARMSGTPVNSRATAARARTSLNLTSSRDSSPTRRAMTA